MNGQLHPLAPSMPQSPQCGRGALCRHPAVGLRSAWEEEGCLFPADGPQPGCPSQLGTSWVGPRCPLSRLAAGHRPCSASVPSTGRGQPGPARAGVRSAPASPRASSPGGLLSPPNAPGLDAWPGAERCDGHRALPGIPGPVELSTPPNCKGLSCSAPTQPALKAAGPAAPRCPQPGPQPRSQHRQRAGEAGLAVAALDSTLGRGLGGGQRLAEDRTRVAVRGCPLGPAEHQGEQASGEPGP